MSSSLSSVKCKFSQFLFSEFVFLAKIKLVKICRSTVTWNKQSILLGLSAERYDFQGYLKFFLESNCVYRPLAQKDFVLHLYVLYCLIFFVSCDGVYNCYTHVHNKFYMATTIVHRVQHLCKTRRVKGEKLSWYPDGLCHHFNAGSHSCYDV